MAEWSPDRLADLALAIEAAALAADSRIAGVEQAVYADSAESVAIASSLGIEGEYSSSSCYGYVQALAESEGGRETGLGFDLGRGPAALDPAAIGREGAERAAAMIGAGKPKSRSCPVVLDPTVAASFIALIGRGLAASAVQRGRSPFAERLGEEVANQVLALHDDGLDPEGFASAPFDAEGVPRRRTALIEAGTLHTYLYDTYTANRGDAASTGNASRSGYRSQPSVSASNLIVAPGELSFAELLARGRRRRSRHRRRRAALRRQPGLGRLLGRRLRAGDPRRRAGRATARVHDRQRSRLDAACRAGGRSRLSLGAFWRLGEDPVAARRRDDGRGILTPKGLSARGVLRRERC